VPLVVHQPLPFQPARGSSRAGFSSAKLSPMSNRRSTAAVDHVVHTPGLSNADKIAILGGSAARLPKITTEEYSP